jgi:hypothetical protein
MRTGVVFNGPLALRIKARAAGETSVFVGYLDPATAVEDATSDIGGVVENAFASAYISGECRCIPLPGVISALFACARRRNAFSVQDVANGLQAMVVGVEIEYPPNQLSLFRANCETIDFPALAVEPYYLCHIP